MKKAILSLAILSLLAVGGPAIAELCTIDSTPAATLLLPYFEVDLSSNTGVTTLFSINNASAAPTVAHVTVWTNASVPVFDFDVYLTGYDIQTLNVRDLLNGVLPTTSAAISNQGDFSDPNVNFTGCALSVGAPPAYPNPAITGLTLEHFRTSLTGDASPLTGDCAGVSVGGNAVGYITVDNVNECNFLFPADAGYFGAGGTGVANNINQLWGDYFQVDPANAFASGENMVHVEADDQFTGGTNAYTFYSRYVAGGIDNREPLGTTYGVRHIANVAFTGGTDLVVWRDDTTGSTARFACGSSPHPLESRQIVIFDEEENPVIAQGQLVSGVPVVGGPEPFPLCTQSVPVNGAALPVPDTHLSGWMYLNLNHADPINTFANDPLSAQAYVSAVYSATGEFSIGIDAVQLDTACNPFTGQIPIIAPAE